MRRNEPDPELRRVVMALFLDDGVTPATDADVSPPAGSLKVTVNGAAPANASGNFVGDGEGEYYYEFSPSEVAADGFVAFLFNRSGYRPEWVTAEVGQLFSVGETSAARLRLPIIIRDDSSPPELVAAAAVVTSSSQLQTALSSVSFSDAAGTLQFVALGLHYYQGAASDAAAEGSLIVRFSKPGYQTETVWTPVSSAVAETPASIVSISPAPLTAPGDPGGFPTSPALAASTPVVVVIADAVPNLDSILLTFTVDGEEEIAYYGGSPRGRYLIGSTQVIFGDQITLSLRRVGGWSTAAGQMTLVVEGVTPDTFSLLLPTTSEPKTSTFTTAVSAGAVDHLAEALDRLPRQFQRRPGIDAMLRILCRPIQEFENTVVDVLSQFGLNEAGDSRLKMIAKLVVQSTDGLADAETIRRFIRAKVATNRSSGTTEELIAVTQLVLGSPDTDITVASRRIKTVVVTLLGTPTSTPVAKVLLGFLRKAKASGDRLKVVYFVTAPLFRFNSGPGFGVGHYMSSIE